MKIYHRNALQQQQQQQQQQQKEQPNNGDEGDQNCIDVCTENEETNDSNRLSTSLSRDIKVYVIQNEEQDDKLDGLFNRLILRWFSKIFRFIFRRSESKERTIQLVIPTNTIVSELSKHSTKFLSLSQSIQEASISDAQTSNRPDIIERMYTLSTENMLSTSNVINDIVLNLQQQNDGTSIDLVTLGCTMIQLLAVLQNSIIPNIELMYMVLSTKSNSPYFNNDVFQQYNTTRNQIMKNRTIATSFIDSISRNNKINKICIDTKFVSSSNVVAVRLFNVSNIFDGIINFNGIIYLIEITMLGLLNIYSIYCYLSYSSLYLSSLVW